MRIGIFFSALALCLPSWANWEAIGPYGGSAAVVQVDPHRSGTVWAATNNAQLFRSDNNGDLWTSIPFPAQLRATLHAFVADPQHPGVYLAGLASDSPEFTGILRTTDGGLTWKHIPDSALNAVWSIAFWPRDSKVIAAGTQDGVFLTRNGGESWARISRPGNRELMPVVSLAFDPSDSNILYVGTPHLPWKTVDGGATWNSIHTGMLDDSDVFSIQVDASRPTRLFASACSGIYRSVNGAGSWSKLIGATGASYRTYQIAQHPTQPNVLFASTTLGLAKSVDGGTSWRRLSSQTTRSVSFDPSHPNRMFVATDDAGIFRSDDLGDSLQPVNRGFSNRRYGSLVASGKTLYVNSLQNSAAGGLLQRMDGGQTWMAVSSLVAQKHPLKVVALDSKHLFVLTPETLLASSNGGQSWSAVPGPQTTSRFADFLILESSVRRILLVTENGVYQTQNAGATWNHAELPSLKDAVPTAFFVGPTMIGLISRSSFWLSPDGIKYSAAQYPANQLEVNGIVLTERNGILAATSRGLMKSEDSGTTWNLLPGTLEGGTVRAIVKHPTQAGSLFASQYGTIFSSSDEGRSWTRFTKDEDTLDSIKSMLAVPDIPDQLFALTQSRGVYRISLVP